MRRVKIRGTTQIDKCPLNYFNAVNVLSLQLLRYLLPGPLRCRLSCRTHTLFLLAEGYTTVTVLFTEFLINIDGYFILYAGVCQYVIINNPEFVRNADDEMKLQKAMQQGIIQRI